MTSAEKALSELENGLKVQTGVKEVAVELVPDGLNSDDDVVFQHYLFRVQLVPSGWREVVRLELSKFFLEETQRLGLKDVRMEIDWQETPIFDPPL